MNMFEMQKLAERGMEFLAYMREFYSKDHGGVYADETDFSTEEIVDGINEYLQDEDNYRGIMQYGADTVDRERVRLIIELAREEATL